MTISILTPDGQKDMYNAMSTRFETLWGLFFNQVIDVQTVESRVALAAQAYRMLREGKLGRAPKNLDIANKISPEKAQELRLAGKEVSDWFVRTPQEQEQYEGRMKAWEREQEELGGELPDWYVKAKKNRVS